MKTSVLEKLKSLLFRNQVTHDKSSLDSFNELFNERRSTFDALKSRFPQSWLNFTCPCCGFPTLEKRGVHDICSICSWQDDGLDRSGLIDTIGPNSTTLREGRADFGEMLDNLAKQIGGKIVSDPQMFIKIFNEFKEKLNTIRNQMNSKTNTNEPIWEEWEEVHQELRRNLIIKS